MSRRCSRWLATLGRLVLPLALPGFLLPGIVSPGLRAEDGTEPTAGTEDEEFDNELREPVILLYVPLDGTADAFHRQWTDHSLARRGYDPLPYGFGPGIAGQARTKGPYGYSGICYPIDGNIHLDEGTLSIWFRWDKGTEKGPFGSFLSEDIFPLTVAHDVFKPIRMDEQWHHIVLTWLRKTRTGLVYLDATKVLEVPLPPKWFRPPPLDDNAKPLPITHDFWIAGNLPGAVDEVYIWDVVIPADGIRKAFERGRKGQTSWPKEALPPPKPWRTLAGLIAIGEKRDPPRVAWTVDKAPRKESSTRIQLSLDGTWHCQPFGQTEYVPTSTQVDAGLFNRRKKVAQWWPCSGRWLEMAVPGTWKPSSEPGTSVPWNASPAAAYYGALCERDFDAPAEWQGKGIFIQVRGKPFRYGGTVCPITVFVNNRPAGESFATDTPALDITDLVTLGRRNRITLLLGYPCWPMDQVTLGGVGLEIRANRDVLVDYAFVTPQENPESIEVIAEVRMRGDKERTVDVECLVGEGPTAKPAKSLGKQPLTLKPVADPRYPMVFRFPNPRRWHPEDPYMYSLSLRALSPDGALLDECDPVRFGFRTLGVRERDLILNGKPFHMRGMSHNSPGPGEGGFAYKKSIGQNADRCLSDYLRPEIDAALDACDREGWLQCYHIDFNPYWRESESTSDREQFWSLMRHVWNHPSVIAWFPFGNGYVNGPHGHPRQIGGLAGVDFDPNNDWYRQARAYSDALHRNVPGRLTFFYRLGVGGDFRGIMHYMGWGTPIQAREEWPSYWHQFCNEPFSLTEGGLPMFSNDYLWQWGRGRGKNPFTGSEAIIEHGARYFGDRMYEDVTRDMAVTLDFTDHGREIKGVAALALGDFNPDFVDRIPTDEGKKADAALDVGDIDDAVMADKGKSKTGIPLATHADTTSAYAGKDKEDGPKGRWDFEFQPIDFHDTPLYWRLKGFAARRTLCAWRTYGISYLIHCCFKRQMLCLPSGELSPLGHTIARYNAPLLLYVGGPPGDFILKDHAFHSGETVSKQIIVRNDHFSPAAVSAAWRAIDIDDQAEVASGKAEFTVDIGALHETPITFPAPPATGKRRLRIVVSATADGKPRPDETFDIQVFPPKPAFAPPTARVGLIDSAGQTAALLRKAGQPFTSVSSADALQSLDLLIIGRKGYTDDTRKLLEQGRAQEAISGGMNVIVFEQTGRWVMGLQNEHFDNRNAFVRDPKSELLDGFTDEDFAEWRGASDLIEAYPDWDRKADWLDGKYSKHGTGNEYGQGRFYHWSNKGMVCSYSYNKPQVGNFRVLLDNAFDLLFTPLVEERIGDGRILFCQLDVTNRYGVDPVASVLVDRILKEYAVKRPAASVRVGYLGGPEGRKMLAPLGLDGKELTPPALSLDGLGVFVVSAAEAGEALKDARPAIEKFLNSGGTVLVLPVTLETPLDWLPVPVKRERGEAFVTKNVRETPLLRGLGPSDFFWRRVIRGVRVSSEEKGAWNADSGLLCSIPFGKGQVVLCQVDPSWFEWTWQQGKAARIWSTLLRNLGAASSLTVDPLCDSDRVFAQIYQVPGLPFDPDAHRVW